MFTLRFNLLIGGLISTYTLLLGHSVNVKMSLDSNTVPTTYKAHIYLTSSELLQNQFRELAKLHPNYSSLVLPPNNRKTTPPAPLKKRFKIVHIGDSHIQNDILSDAIRQQFQQHFGNAGCGFLFPYGLAKSYGPRGISARTTGIWIDYKTMTPSFVLS